MLKRHSDNLKENRVARKYCENFFLEKFDTKAVFLNSASSGIYLFFKSLKLDKSDEVIIQDYTHPASKIALKMLGRSYIPCRNKGLIIDVDDAISKVTANTRVIVYTMLNGFVDSDILKLRDFCTLHNILLFIDAAPGLGAKINDIDVGSIGDAAVFSFSTTKLIALGGGGAFISSIPEITKYVDEHKDLNFSLGSDFDSFSMHFHWGLWEALQGELEEYDNIVKGRVEIHNKLLKEIPYFITTDSNKCYSAGSVMLPLHLIHKRDDLMERFKKANIQCRAKTYNHSFSNEIYNSHIDIPFHRDLTNEDIKSIKNIFKQAGIE